MTKTAGAEANKALDLPSGAGVYLCGLVIPWIADSKAARGNPCTVGRAHTGYRMVSEEEDADDTVASGSEPDLDSVAFGFSRTSMIVVVLVGAA